MNPVWLELHDLVDPVASLVEMEAVSVPSRDDCRKGAANFTLSSLITLMYAPHKLKLGAFHARFPHARRR